jgi:NADH-quinone oxidoreductase subunit A
MQFQLANILVFVGLGLGFLVVTLFLGSLLRPRTPEDMKLAIYECGETPLSQAWFNFNPRFYIVALVFLIFDVEVAFTYPVANVFLRWVAEGNGLYAFVEILLFVAILAVGLAYVWVKGDLEWVRRSKDDAEWKLIQARLPTRAADDTGDRKAA